MKLFRFLFVASIFFASLHFSFIEVKAVEGSEPEEVKEEVQGTTEELPNEELESEPTGEVQKTEEEPVIEEETEITEESNTDSETHSSPEVPAADETEVKAEDSNVDEPEAAEQEEQEAEEVMTFSTFSVQQATMPYKLGDYHEDLISIKQKLNAIGFGGISETDYFGSWTETRVTQFQEYYGLPGTGEIDQATWNKINEVYSSPFQLGERHDATIELKEKLNSLGYGYISISNLYGSWTENRVKKFQRENGLRVNGIADERTWAKINELINELLSQTEFKVGDRHPNIVLIKQKLNAIGFDGISETDYYGNWTRTRVLEFQEYYGLAETGTTNKATLDKLNEVYTSPFQLGKRHEDTIKLKEKLNSLGYGHISVTDLYGSWTVNRVEKFQRENGLRVNGIADERTWAKLNELLSQTEFKVGDRHPNIVAIKQKLNALGFDGISETDYFGSWTRTRVKQFQAYYGLPETGITDTATIEKLDEVYHSPFQAGKRHASTIELKEKLNAVGYGYISVTDFYGSFTVNQVKKFQRDQGLQAHGIADEKTWAMLDNLLAKTEFKVGDHHPDIASLKAKLNAIGFGEIAETNYFGSWTETRVRHFQTYYGIPATGQLDKTTINKLNQVYDSPYQLGKSHEDLIDFKHMLNALGYGYITVTENYGSWTQNRVVKFQKDNNLVANGILDEVTLQKLNELYDSRNVIEEFNITLEEALNQQMKVAPQTDHSPGYIDSSHTDVTGVITGTSHLRKEPTTASSITATLSKNSKITILEKVYGEELWAGNTWYKVLYDGKESYLYGNLVTNMTAKVDSDTILRVRAGTNTSSRIYAELQPNTVVNVTSFEDNGWLLIGTEWRNAHKDNVRRYLDPSLNDPYQHLDLSSNLGISAAQLDAFLDKRLVNYPTSVLKGKGETFKQAAAMPGQTINELYLISHALLETAYGTSNLASGVIEVGEVSNNKWVTFVPDKRGNIIPYTAELKITDNKTNWIIKQENNFDRSKAKNIRKTYNMFGIEAVDSHPEIRGSVRAYREGWYNVDAAITGGAKFIAGDYIHNQYNQNTLYKMRWNPAAMDSLGYATKQYATDIRWAVKQVGNIKALLSDVDLLDSPLLRFNFIQYK